jgi:hypothetical protein
MQLREKLVRKPLPEFRHHQPPANGASTGKVAKPVGMVEVTLLEQNKLGPVTKVVEQPTRTYCDSQEYLVFSIAVIDQARLTLRDCVLRRNKFLPCAPEPPEGRARLQKHFMHRADMNARHLM